MKVSDVTLLSQTVKKYGRGETLLSLLDPVNATISIVPALPLQEVGRLAFTYWQHSGPTYCHILGGSGGGPSCPYFPKGVT